MIHEYLWYLFIYSILGWLIEVIYQFLNHKGFINRGFLNGPYCPIYGFGAVFEIMLLTKYIKRPLLLYIVAVVITTLIEFLTGYVLEKIFKLKWWDYSLEKFNILGYVCLKFSLLWGIASLILMYVVQPIIKDLVNVLNAFSFAIYIVIFIVFVDYVFTILKLISFKKDINILLKLDKEINTLKILIEKRLNRKYKRLLKSYPHLRKIIKRLKK